MKFSNIDFTENPIDAQLGEEERESVGCIQLIVIKRRDVHASEHGALYVPSSQSTALKVWERDKKIAGKMSIATRYAFLFN
jgi:hypothetical protein